MPPRNRPSDDDNPIDDITGHLFGEDDDLTPEEVREALAGIPDPDDQWTWLQEHADSMSDATFEEAQASIQSTAEDQGVDTDPEPNPVGTQVVADQAAEEAYNSSRDRARERVAELIARANQTGASVVEADIMAVVAEEMPDDLGASEQGAWGREVWEGGVEIADQQARDDQESRGEAATGLSPNTIIGDSTFGTPYWLLAATGYGELTEQQQNRLVDYWNDAYNTSFSSYTDLVKSGALGSEADRGAPDAMTMRVVEAAITGQEPVEEMRIDLPGVTDPIRVSLADQEYLRDWYGMSTDGIVRLARLGTMSGRVDPETGRPIPVNLFELAAIAAAYGIQSDVAEQGQNEDRIAQIRRQLAHTPSNFPTRSEWVSSPQYRALAAEIRRLQQSNVSERSPQDLVNRQQGAGPGILGLQNQFYRGLQMYGQDQDMALIHTVDSTLASRIAQSGGDPEKLSAKDAAKAWDILVRAGRAESDGGFRPDSAIFSNFSSYFDGGSGGGGGGGGRVRRIIDPEGVRQQVKSLWQGLFLAEAPEELIKAFTASLQASLDAAPEGMDFEVSARIQDWIQGQGLYKDLYGKKPEGMTETDYQAQFYAGSASILGEEAADPEAIKAGMRNNEYQTTVGSAFAAGAARGNNSTLQERLARAANIVAANT